jgi:hypothetical protein
MNRDASFGEPLGDEAGGFDFLESDFGVGVQMPPPLRQFVLAFGDRLEDGHRRFFNFYGRSRRRPRSP